MDEVNKSQQVRGRRELEFLPIEARPLDGSASERWCVFDPLSRQSYRLGWKEKWFLCRAKNWQTPQALALAFLDQNPGQGESAASLVELVMQLASTRLLHTRLLSPQGDASDASYQSNTSSASSWLSKLVSLQIRGYQPERWLGRMTPYTGFLFSTQAVLGWLALAIFAMAAALLNFERLSSEVGTTGFWLRPAVGGSLFVVFIITRGLHELGHALACTRFGIRCPDIGLFLILGAPCVYCDVSESWKLTERWKRAAVAAAGMYVELIVASLAAIFWCVTLPGPMHSLAMQTMLVCSISTLLINLNPLMRFDGYYILADWLDEANLRSKSDAVALGLMKRYLLGVPTTTGSMKRRKRAFFLTFSIAGYVYRIFLSITIASVVVVMFSNWHLPWLGRGLALAILVSWWSSSMIKFLYAFLRQLTTSRWRMASLCTGGLVLLLVAPLPNRRLAVGWIEPQNSSGVYAENSGLLLSCFVEDGDRVEAGQQLFQFASSELELQRISLQRAGLAAATQNLHATYAKLDPSKDTGVSQVDVRHAEARLQDAVARLASLTCLAPVAGKLISFPATPAAGPWSKELRAEARRASWCDTEQIGRTVPAGTLMGAVCSDRRQAVVELEKSQLQDVVVGTIARVRILQADMSVIESRVKAIVEFDSLTSNWHATADSNTEQALAPKFAAIVELPDSVAALPGSSVDVVFIGRPTRLATRLYRWARTNLNLLSD